MPHLRARILDRVDQLERTAKAVPGSSIWTARQVSGRTGLVRPTAEHVARWNPAVVLVLCAGAREIVELHGYRHDCEGANGPWSVPDGQVCATLRATARMFGLDPTPERGPGPDLPSDIDSGLSSDLGSDLGSDFSSDFSSDFGPG